MASCPPPTTKGGAGAHCLETHVHHEGAEVMLSFGQCRGNAQCHVLCVSAAGHAGLWGRRRKQRSGLPCHGPYDWPPYHLFQPSPPTTHLLGSLNIFIFLLSKKYAHMLLLGDTEKTWVVVRPAQVSAGAGLHLLGNQMPLGRNLGCDTHGPGSLRWNGMVREKQASS